MKRITVENYEAFFLDYIEGNLDELTKLELESFLHLHPHLKEELERADTFYITPNTCTFADKDTLKKFQFENQPVNAVTFNDFCIAAHEGLLKENKQEELANFMQSDGTLLKEYISYGKAFLRPEEMYYPSKHMLYHKVRLVKFGTVLLWGSVAAGLMLLFIIYAGYFSNTELQKPELTYQNPSSPIISKPTHIGKEEVITSPEEKAKSDRSDMAKTERAPQIKASDEVLPEEEAVYEAYDQPEPGLASMVIIEPELSVTDSVYASEEKIIAVAGTVDPAGTVDFEDGEKLKLLALVEEGVEKINKVTQSDNLGLAHKTTPSGKIKSFSIKLGFIGFERKKARN